MISVYLLLDCMDFEPSFFCQRPRGMPLQSGQNGAIDISVSGRDGLYVCPYVSLDGLACRKQESQESVDKTWRRVVRNNKGDSDMPLSLLIAFSSLYPRIAHRQSPAQTICKIYGQSAPSTILLPCHGVLSRLPRNVRILPARQCSPCQKLQSRL